jgi:hypothetical protein
VTGFEPFLRSCGHPLSSASDLAATEAAAEAAADKLQRHYLEYLLRAEALPLAEARGHAAALRAAVTSTESMS